MNPVPLHNHSEYSAFDGMATVDEIIARIKELGSPAVGLTDHGVISGHLEFGKKCFDAGIKPIFGLEAYQARDHRKKVHKLEVINPDKDKARKSANDTFHLILLAKNDQGLRNLWKLSTLAFTEGYAHGKPRMDLELLEQHHEGLIATSACLGSKTVWELAKGSEKAALDLANIFGDDWYIELHTYDTKYQQEMNIELVRVANKHGWPVVYATDAHYACLDDYEHHDAFNTMTQRTTMSDPERIHHPPSLWIQGEQDIRDTFSYLPKSTVDEAISNSVRIAEQCDVSLPQPRNRVPVFFPDKPKSYGPKFLIELIEKEFESRFARTDQEDVYRERLEKELEVILDAKLVDFFLIEWDIMRFSKEEGIPTGPGRGSVGGSLVAYLLGITDIDPIRYDLIFERFYNKGREKGGMPDIDTDFPADQRHLIKEYVAKRWGEDHVASIGTVSRLQGKSAIERVGKILEISQADINTIKAIVDSTTDAGLLADWDDILEVPELQYWMEEYPKLFEYAGKFHNRIFTYGVHASGFLVSDQALDETFPLKVAKDEVSTQFDMHEAAKLGFMKIDFLGLRNLDILEETKKIIKDIHGIEWDYRNLHHKTDDEIASMDKVWNLLDSGLTVGLFQVEDGQAAKSIAKEMKCRSIEDLAILVALNRPGPLRGGMVASFVKARNGAEWHSPHPILDEILDETLGTFIYQEQVIRYMTALGFDLETADEVRSFIGKKKVDKMAEFYPTYLTKAKEFMPEATAEGIWESILDFAKYGFNKAHAVGYGIILFWTACAKAFYPAEYMLACMRVDTDDKKRYIAEAMRMNIQVSGPKINKSSIQADLIEGQILMGLSDVKGVGQAEWVIENRPFKGYEHSLNVMDEQNKIYLKAKKDGEVEGPSPKQRFGAGKFKALYNAGAYDDLEDRGLSKHEIRELQRELLGVVLDNDGPKILAKHADMIQEECDSFEVVIEPGETYFIAGAVSSFEKRKTKNNTDMAWVTVENNGQTMRLAAFGSAFTKHQDKMQECSAIIAEIKKTERGQNIQNVIRLR